MVAQHPGLANPEISKIIGEQWQNQPAEEKNRWKALAEEEKIRHQQQYPTYRYQPKRNGRRNSHSDQSDPSTEKPKCQKCGGRTILTPSTPFSGAYAGSVPRTPGSSVTPVSRTLPILRNLSLQSPAARRNGRSYQSNMSPSQNDHMIERDDLGPLSPDNKRRRFNGDHGTSVSRAMPPRYGVHHPGTVVGPGTPFPFGQAPPLHPYPPAAVHARRESLPGLRGVVSPPGPMAPPPRPGMGYQQHRLSQGHVPQDRSLTLPPLQTARPEPSTSAVASGRTSEEQIMSLDFRYKIKVLSQIAPPATKAKEHPRGPLIAVEGDSAEAAKEFAGWLSDMLNGSDDLAARVVDGPKISASGGKEEVMAQYHRLVSEWLIKSKDILGSIMVPTASGNTQADSAMPDAVLPPPQSGRKIDKNYDDADTESRQSDKVDETDKSDDRSECSSSNAPESMNLDKDLKRKSTASTSTKQKRTSAKPISIIANYSLSTSNLVACLIPLGPNDPYSPNDHWQWTATQWRGIIGPDLTIYVRDAVSIESGRPPVEIEVVDGRIDVGLFVMRRTKPEHQDSGIYEKETTLEVEASVLRRMGFEVGEWVRAFGTSNTAWERIGQHSSAMGLEIGAQRWMQASIELESAQL